MCEHVYTTSDDQMTRLTSRLGLVVAFWFPVADLGQE